MLVIISSWVVTVLCSFLASLRFERDPSSPDWGLNSGSSISCKELEAVSSPPPPPEPPEAAAQPASVRSGRFAALQEAASALRADLGADEFRTLLARVPKADRETLLKAWAELSYDALAFALSESHDPRSHLVEPATVAFANAQHIRFNREEGGPVLDNRLAGVGFEEDELIAEAMGFVRLVEPCRGVPKKRPLGGAFKGDCMNHVCALGVQLHDTKHPTDDLGWQKANLAVEIHLAIGAEMLEPDMLR